MGASQFLLGIGMVLAQSLFGAGNTRFVMWVELTCHVFCLVPLSYVLGIVLDFGLAGIWSAGAVYMFSVASLMFYKFREGKWKHIKI
jgi:Na+-driven multidrug efflux pump